MIDIKKSKIAVLGLGREGLDLLKFLNKQKPDVVIGLDSRTDKDLSNLSELKKLTTNLYLGADHLKHFDECDLVFKSPGVPNDLPEIKAAKKRGLTFSSVTQLFFDLCPAKIVGVTGTKGKSTTSSLIHHLIKEQKTGKVYLKGNIGYPPLSLLSKLTKNDVVVMELSSFQLEDLNKSPALAVVLNIVPEHLSRHKTFVNYLRAKSNLWLHQRKADYLIASADHKSTKIAIKESPAKAFKFSSRKVLSRGVYLSNGKIILRNSQTGKREVIVPSAEVPLLGRANLDNCMAAIAVAHLLKLPTAVIRKRLKSFKPLAHRLELVGRLKKISFVNDSMATTPVAVLAAVDALDSPISLILGGVSKGEKMVDFIPLLNSPKLAAMVLIGQMADKLAKWLKQKRSQVPAVKAKTLKEAIIKGARYLPEEENSTILLSPGFASFDMFKDAYDRGDTFKRIAKNMIKSKQIK